MKKTTLEFLEAHQSETPSKWREEAEWRRDNWSWLQHSQRIAVKALLRMKTLGLTQKALAERMQCTQQYVSKILKGKENMSLDTLTRLENALDISLILDSHGVNYAPYDEEPLAVAEAEGEYNANNNRLGIKEKLSWSITTRVGKLFFDLKNNAHSEYLKITQSKRIGNDAFQRDDIFLDRSELLLFRDAIDKAVKYWDHDVEPLKDNSPSKSYTLEERRKDHSYAYERWDEEADALLGRLFNEGHSIPDLSEMFERSVGSIRSRLKVIGKL